MENLDFNRIRELHNYVGATSLGAAVQLLVDSLLPNGNRVDQLKETYVCPASVHPDELLAQALVDRFVFILNSDPLLQTAQIFSSFLQSLFLRGVLQAEFILQWLTTLKEMAAREDFIEVSIEFYSY